MAEEQNERLRNGTFGAVAGSSVGGLAALLQNDTQLLLLGVFGSAVGAFLGWLVYLLLSLVASSQWGRRLLHYHVRGLGGVRQQLEEDDQRLVLSALDEWAQSFRRLVEQQRVAVINSQKDTTRDGAMCVVIRAWLTTITDMFNLILGVLAKKPQYRLRASIMVYKRGGDKVVGKHWISYAGPLPAHQTKEFDDKSIAYKVLVEEVQSPYFTSLETANKQGQDRGGRSYHSFFMFRLNDNAVLAVDWPGNLDADDPYVKVARNLYQLDVVPALQDLLSQWSRPVQEELGLTP
jgi:hypothetical protein